MHAKWSSYFKQFNFVIHHKSEIDNKVLDALSRRVSLLISLKSEIIGFEFLKDLYKEDKGFAEIWEKCSSRQSAKDYHTLDGFFLKWSQLCVPGTSLREKVIRDLHGGGLMGTLQETRLRLALKRDIIGLNYGKTWQPLWEIVCFVKSLKDKLKIWICIHLYPFSKIVRKTWAWISCWDFLAHKRERISSS